jgi:hypothetical protein
MSPFLSLREYERYVYSLPTRFPAIAHSTLTVQRRGRMFGEVRGDVLLRNGRRLTVYERLAWDAGPLTIVGYSYEVWRADEQLWWYDSQSHPNESSLAETRPHHKHMPPDIRHNRRPAPSISFTQPNLVFLVVEAADA